MRLKIEVELKTISSDVIQITSDKRTGYRSNQVRSKSAVKYFVHRNRMDVKVTPVSAFAAGFFGLRCAARLISYDRNEPYCSTTVKGF
jgi:hypothetical protein